MTYYLLGTIAWMCYLLAMFTDPGKISKEWSHRNLRHVKVYIREDMDKLEKIVPDPDVMQKIRRKRKRSVPQYTFCFKCNVVKPYRAHHCKTCDR